MKLFWSVVIAAAAVSGWGQAFGTVPFAMNGASYQVEHVSGTGSNKAIMEMDFGSTGSPKPYVFGFQWNPAVLTQPTARDIMTALRDDNIGVSFDEFPPSPPFNSYFLNTLFYQANQPPNFWPDSFWFWFTSADGQKWDDALTGYDHTPLAANGFYGWSLQHDDPNIDIFEPPFLPATHPPAPLTVPEPATLAMIGLAAAGFLRRRR